MIRFEIERMRTKLTNLNCRSELHGSDHVPAADLHIELRAPNDLLSEFSPDLKSSLYRRAESNGDQAELIDQPGYLPKMRFPDVEGFAWRGEMVGATLTIHYGINERSDIVLSETIVDQLRFELADGGMVTLKFRARCKPDEHQIGKLYVLTQREVDVTLAPPAAPEKNPDGWPFPAKGKGAEGQAGKERAIAADIGS